MDTISEFVAAIKALCADDSMLAIDKAPAVLAAAKGADALLDLEELVTWFEWDDNGDLVVIEEL